MRRAWMSLALVFAIVAVACTGEEDGLEPTDTGGGPVEIIFWHGNTGRAGRALKELVAEFNDTHPDIQVTEQFYGNTDRALQKVETAVASGEYPDIAYLYGSWAANIAESPKVLALNDLIESDPEFAWEDFWPAEQLAATVEGRIIAVPALVDNLAVLYNKDLFDEAGVEYPAADWTWDDFRAAAKAITDPEAKIFGWEFAADASEDTVWHWEAMLWEAGGDILNEDNTQAAFNSEAGVQALEMVRAMAIDDKSVYIDTTNTKRWDLFNSGNIGLYVTGPWDLPDLTVNYGVQVMPSFGDPANHQTISGPDNWVLFDNGETRSKAAFEFIKWYTSGEQDLKNAMVSATLPIRQSELELPEYKDLLKEYPGIDVFVENMNNAVKARPITPAYPQISEALGNAIVSVLLGKADAKTALDQAAQETNSILATA